MTTSLSSFTDGLNMAFTPQVYTFSTMATGASITPTLQMPGNYLYFYLVVPTMTAYSASTPIYIKMAATSAGPFYRFVNVESNTSTVGTNDFSIVSSVSQRMINITNLSCQFIQLEISGTATTPAASSPFQIIAVSNQ